MTKSPWVIEGMKRTINGIVRDVVQIKVGDRVLEAIELDMADQWDFMEMAGAQIDNHAWVNTALLAASVISIDGIPQPTGAKTREGIRHILRKIGASGIDALHAAFQVEEPTEAHASPDEASAVGN